MRRTLTLESPVFGWSAGVNPPSSKPGMSCFQRFLGEPCDRLSRPGGEEKMRPTKRLRPNRKLHRRKFEFLKVGYFPTVTSQKKSRLPKP
jgi:hypothetical protein